MGLETFSNMKIFLLKTKHDVIVANGTVLVGGTVEVKFTMMKGPNGLFASLPGRKDPKGAVNPETGKPVYYSDVKIPNKEDYAGFQKMAQDATKKALGVGTTPKPKAALGEENQAPSVNNDDCPF
jgi:hypothetical protein